jgi:hypothetical protein
MRPVVSLAAVAFVLGFASDAFAVKLAVHVTPQSSIAADGIDVAAARTEDGLVAFTIRRDPAKAEYQDRLATLRVNGPAGLIAECPLAASPQEGHLAYEFSIAAGNVAGSEFVLSEYPDREVLGRGVVFTARLADFVPQAAGREVGAPEIAPGPSVPRYDTAGLEAKLEVVDEPSRPWTESIARVRLTVENRGERPLPIFRLRAGWLEHDNGRPYGWDIKIEGPGGEYRFPLSTGLVPTPTQKDYIELAPGESFSTILCLERAAHWDGGVRRPLASTPGDFTVSVSFAGLKIEPLKFTKK